MQKILLSFFIYFLIMSTGNASALAEDMITLELPQGIITKAVKAALPIKIDAHSKSLAGDITIINISELQLSKDLLSCRLHLAGNNLALITEIAGHEIRLKVGSVEINFKTDAGIRFDANEQMLYIKPLVRDLKNGDGSNADIGQALVALFNGREFPIQMQKLDPLVADTGTREITINSRISNIAAKPKAIQLSLIPTITAK